MAMQNPFSRPDITSFDKETEKRKGKGFYYKGREFVHHSSLHHSESAVYTLSRKQKIIFLCLFAFIVAGLVWNWHLTIIVMIAGLTVLYFADLLFNLYLVYRSFSKPAEIQIAQTEIDAVDEKDWPSY